MNRYLQKIAEENGGDTSWLIPAVGVSIPTAAAGLSHYASIRTKERFEPHNAELNTAMKRTALKSALGLSLIGGTAAAAAELARRSYLESQKKEQNKELTTAVRSTIRSELERQVV